MSDLDAGVTLTPEENAFFESGGKSAVVEEKPEAVEKPAPVAEEAKEKVSGKEQPETDKAEKVVPLAALHEERGKRKTLEQTVQQLREENARYNERFKIVEQLNKPAPQAPPDPTQDPIAALQHADGELKTLKEWKAQQEQHAQQAAARQQVVSLYAQDAERFKAENPDWPDAYKFASDARVRQYQLIGHQNPIAAAQADELQIVVMALQQGKSPAEFIYGLAGTFGYQKKAADKPGNGAADKLDKIQQGQEANKSLSSAGGTSGGDEMTAQVLMKMPLDEFEAWCNKNPAKAKRLMGG